MGTPAFTPKTESTAQLIPLELIRVATPCRAQWDKMTGDDKVRFCGSCAKNVYNLSAMTRDEAERLMREKEGNLCVQLHRRSDGTVITRDCPVGISQMRRSGGMLRNLVGAAVAAVVGIFGLSTAHSAPKKKPDVRRVGGRMVVSKPQSGAVRGKPSLTKPPAKITPPKTARTPVSERGEIVLGRVLAPTPQTTPVAPTTGTQNSSPSGRSQ